ncbi:hypothetical protein ABH922_002759 [Rhodococcus sp. 27YEA15]|uniref:hypothetical protein n=1 Tax=Rhodococcus sp. 27YEA15 TaxID=3156259 RepID=UPI003C7B727B
MTAVVAVQRHRALAAIEVYDAALQAYELPDAPRTPEQEAAAAARLISAGYGLRAALPL